MGPRSASSWSTHPSTSVCCTFLALLLLGTLHCASATTFSVYITSNPAVTEWNGDCQSPGACGASAGNACKLPSSLLAIRNMNASNYDSCILYLSGSAVPYNFNFSVPEGLSLTLRAANALTYYTGLFSIWPIASASMARVEVSNVNFNFTNPNHGIYYHPLPAHDNGGGIVPMPSYMYFFATEIINPRIGGRLNMSFSNADFTFVESAYTETGTKPFDLNPLPTDSASIYSSNWRMNGSNPMLVELFSNIREIRITSSNLVNLNISATEYISVYDSNGLIPNFTNCALKVSTSNWPYAGESLKIEHSTLTDSTVSSTSLSITSSILKRTSATFGYGTIHKTTLIGDPLSKPILRPTVDLSILSNTTVSNYIIKSTNAGVRLANPPPEFSDCEFDVSYLYLPSEGDSMQLGDTNTLKVGDLVFQKDGFAFAVTFLEVISSIGATSRGTLNVLPSDEKYSRWTMASGVLVQEGVTVNMTGLDEFKFVMSTQDGLNVPWTTTKLTRFFMTPLRLRIEWALAIYPTPGTAYRVLSTSGAIDPAITEILPFAVNNILYNGTLEIITPPAAQNGGRVSLRIGTPVPASPSVPSIPVAPYIPVAPPVPQAAVEGSSGQAMLTPTLALALLLSFAFAFFFSS